MAADFLCEAAAPLVQTDRGPVRGYHLDGVDVFKGIPYGRARRFCAARPPAPWARPLDATSYGCVCPLLNMARPMDELQVPHRYWVQDEDCLNLNLWTPACDGARRPVAVWLHGGGFSEGSAMEQLAYEGGAMALAGDCVVVSVNHRLNILGYWDLSAWGPEYAGSANNGTADLVLALQWVRRNIAAFGGDPDNVTLMGQSGGGGKIIALMQTPAADGLYRAGVIMSGVLDGLMQDCTGPAAPGVEAVLARLGLADVRALEQVPFPALARAYNETAPALAAQGVNVGCAPAPVPGGYAGSPLGPAGFRPQTLGVPLLVGSVFAEFYGFVPGRPAESPAAVLGEEAAARLAPLFAAAYPGRPASDVLAADTLFRAAAIRFIRARAAAEGTVYSYLFNQDFPLHGGTPPWHCADIPFLLHNIRLVPACRFAGAQALEGRMFGALMAFLRGGSPGWHPCTPRQENTMLFGPACGVAVNHDHALVDALAPYAPRLLARMRAAGAEAQH